MAAAGCYRGGAPILNEVLEVAPSQAELPSQPMVANTPCNSLGCELSGLATIGCEPIELGGVASNLIIDPATIGCEESYLGAAFSNTCTFLCR